MGTDNNTQTRSTLHKFIRFLLVGGVNTAVGYVMFSALILISFTPQPALAISFSLGVLWNFWTHGRFVFGQNKLSRLPAYALCYLFIYFFNSVVLAFALRQGLGPLLAQAFIAPVTAVLSFFLISRVLTGRYPGSA